MDNSTSLFIEIYKSRNFLLEILESVGYDTKDYIGFSQNEIHIMIQNKKLDMLLEKKDKTRKIYVHYYFDKTMKLANLQNIIADLIEISNTLNKNDTIFIIKEDDANDSLMSDLKHIWETEKVYIVVESRKRLQFNVLNHVIQPKFEIIEDPVQVDNIKNKYNIKDNSQFPEISRFDPVAKALCLRPGQLLCCLRESKTAIIEPYYRICI